MPSTIIVPLEYARSTFPQGPCLSAPFEPWLPIRDARGALAKPLPSKPIEKVRIKKWPYDSSRLITALHTLIARLTVAKFAECFQLMTRKKNDEKEEYHGVSHGFYFLSVKFVYFSTRNLFYNCTC